MPSPHDSSARVPRSASLEERPVPWRNESSNRVPRREWDLPDICFKETLDDNVLEDGSPLGWALPQTE